MGRSEELERGLDTLGRKEGSARGFCTLGRNEGSTRWFCTKGQRTRMPTACAHERVLVRAPSKSASALLSERSY